MSKGCALGKNPSAWEDDDYVEELTRLMFSKNKRRPMEKPFTILHLKDRFFSKAKPYVCEEKFGLTG